MNLTSIKDRNIKNPNQRENEDEKDASINTKANACYFDHQEMRHSLTEVEILVHLTSECLMLS